jgi:hypothetical protein
LSVASFSGSFLDRHFCIGSARRFFERCYFHVGCSFCVDSSFDDEKGAERRSFNVVPSSVLNSCSSVSISFVSLKQDFEKIAVHQYEEHVLFS